MGSGSSIKGLAVVAILIAFTLASCNSNGGSSSEDPTPSPSPSEAVVDPTATVPPSATSVPATQDPVGLTISHVEQLSPGSIEGAPPSVIPHIFRVEGGLDPSVLPPTLLEAISISPAFSGRPDNKPYGVRLESAGSETFAVYFSQGEPSGEYLLTVELPNNPPASVTFDHSALSVSAPPTSVPPTLAPQPTATAQPPTVSDCQVANPDFGLAFDQRLEPGSVQGPPPELIPYRFIVTGAQFGGIDQVSVRTCPSYTNNVPFGLREGGVLLLYLIPGVAGGTFTVEVTLPGDLKASATFVHTP